MIVRFASVSDVREFVGLATLQPYAIDVVDGEHVVSAKNFMELFTINFTHRADRRQPERGPFCQSCRALRRRLNQMQAPPSDRMGVFFARIFKAACSGAP